MAWFGRAGAVARQHNVQGTAIDRIVVMNDDCTETGGAAAIALATALSVRKRGIRVTFLSSGSAPDPRLIESGVENHCLGGRQLMEGSRPLAAVRGIFDVRSAAALSDWIRANDTPGTCYHLHNWHKALSPSIFGPLRSVSARLLMTAHDYFVACPNGGYFNYSRQQPCELIPASARCIVSDCDRRHYGHKVWRLARHRVRQAVFNFERAAAHVVAVHEGMVPYLERGGIPRGAIRVLRNPVRARRAERVMVERNSRVMFIGRLEEDKGVRQLALAARKAGLPLCVLGAGPLARYLKDEHPEVSLLGWQPPDRIAELLGSAQFVVAPSRWRETFGLVPLEAVMSGVPVVVSSFALISREIVEHGFGLACDPHDINQLADTMWKLARDKETLRRMSIHGFAEARRLAPTEDEWCDGLLKLYGELLGHGPVGRLSAAFGSPSLPRAVISVAQSSGVQFRG